MGLCIDMCTDVCTDMCIDVCIDMSVHMSIHMCIDIYIDTELGMCADDPAGILVHMAWRVTKARGLAGQ